MAVKFRIKRRAAGGAAGAPTSLENAELAYNEQDSILYLGIGTGGAGGTATSIIPIAGPGWAAPLASPTFTGTPAVPTAAADTSTTQAASTAFVLGQANSTAGTIAMNGTQAAGTSAKYARADHVHPSDTTRAPLASPTFTGTPAAPTAAADTATTQLATTAFVIGQAGSATPAMSAGAGTVGTSLKFARQDHAHPDDTSKANLASPTFTGVPAAPTAAADTATTQLATTAFVTGQASSTAGAALGVAATGTSLKYARADHVHVMPRTDQLTAPTAAVSFNSQRITNVADPTSAQDAATRAYVDAATSGQRWLGARLASTVAVSETSATATTLPVGGTSLTVDGVATANGDIVLLKDQTTAARNGGYTVSGVGTSVLLTRIAAMDAANEIDGKVFIIEDGTQAGQVWITVSEVTTLGTDSIVFTRKSDASDIVDGNGLVFTGLTLNVVGTAGRISVGANAVDIDSGYIGQASITTLGTIATGVWNGTAIAAANGGTGQAGGYTTGDLLQATGASTLSKLASVATGNALLSGGVGTASAWGKVGLTTHVSGTLAVGNGGTGATTLTGYVKGSGASALTASSTIPSTDISGLGNMSTQNASAVAITGGTIDGVVFDGGTF